MANVLSFDVSKGGEDGFFIVTPRVDGVMLTTLVEQFERDHGMTDPAGGYGGLIPTFFRFGRLDRYFLGESETPLIERPPGHILVLGCECGEVECWPLACMVDLRDSEIVWHSFAQPHRPARDYSVLGPFVFKRAQYLEALRGLPKVDL